MGLFDKFKKNKTEEENKAIKPDNVSKKIVDNKQIIYLSGDVNSNNSAQIEASIDSLLEEGLDLIIDCEKLNYISSAGLRVLLRLRKNHESLRVVNVKPEVYDVFEMTGFTKIMTIEKGYRVLSIEGCDVIGRGANGLVYRYDAETVLKVYNDANDLAAIIHEREVARKALILGVPTALSYDVVKVNDSYASVFELIDAKSFTNVIQESPERLSELVDISVDLLHQIHSIEPNDDDLPHIKDKALGWKEYLKEVLDPQVLDKLQRLIESVPDVKTIVHGDFHIKNIMLQKGEALLIDMDTLSIGNPLFEFSQIYLSYKAFGELDQSCVTDFLEISWDQAQYLLEEIIKRYFKTDDISDYLDKCALLAYAKLLRRHVKRHNGTNEEREYLKRRIGELVNKFDTLA